MVDDDSWRRCEKIGAEWRQDELRVHVRVKPWKRIDSRKVKAWEGRGKETATSSFLSLLIFAIENQFWMLTHMVLVSFVTFDGVATGASLAVNASPYMFFCDLYGDIIAEKTKLTIISDDYLQFNCEKAIHGIEWPRLTPPQGTEEEIYARRVKAMRDAKVSAKIAADNAAKEKRRVARDFLEKQWAIEDSSSSREQKTTKIPSRKPSCSVRMSAQDGIQAKHVVRLNSKSRTNPIPPPPRPRTLVDVTMSNCSSLPARLVVTSTDRERCNSKHY